MSNETKSFQVGTTYFCRFICDSESTANFEVIARKGAMISLKSGSEIIRKRVKIWNGAEFVLPFGRYSMSPILSAEKVVK